MGFFSSISSFGSSLIEGVSRIGGAICSGISSIGNKIGGFVGKIIETTAGIFTKLELEGCLKEVIELIVDIVVTIGEALGIIKEDETPEEIAIKAEQSDKKPEDFDSINDYIKYLREEIEIDKEKIGKLREEDKLAYQAAGSMIIAKGISESKGIEVTPEFLIEAAKQKMSAREVEVYIDNFKKNNMDLNLTDYLKCEMNKDDIDKTDDIMRKTLKELYPELSDEEIKEKIEEMSEISLKDFE